MTLHLNQEQIPKAIGLGVFMLHSNCNHSCIPNSEAVVYKIPQTSEQLDNEQIEKEFSFSYQGQNLEILREGALLRLVTKRLDDQDQNTKNIVINKGEEITISYLSEDELLLPVSERRRLLLQDYGFECNCPRCQLETINIQKQ
ncbi:MAG: hypothetical protein EZS28_022412 [Streblomastix strix]|uniref:SET domain-containing protein n=1 Tax=Streblomastix strix TaxID=222440 RepID=A0A5J4VHN7_9EUKA|nr:MAG: hypothetical protein EZS28_022412 [Streblomastix strix]